MLDSRSLDTPIISVIDFSKNLSDLSDKEFIHSTNFISVVTRGNMFVYILISALQFLHLANLYQILLLGTW